MTERQLGYLWKMLPTFRVDLPTPDNRIRAQRLALSWFQIQVN